MTLKIKVYSDFICPFCFLAKAPLEEAIKGRDVELEWMPFELRPSPAPPIDPWQDPSKLSAWESYITPTAKKLGLHMTLPHVSPHPYTHLAFEGYQYAKENRTGNEYISRVFQAFFQEDQNIGEIEVLTALAGEVGLNKEKFKNALVTRKYAEIHQNALKQAYEEAHITAVPTMIIGGETVQGLTNQETLEQIIDQELQK